jgi:hypothetical protein
MKELKDSGKTREYETGAHRDNNEGKGRCDLIPMREMAELMNDPVIFCIADFYDELDEGYLFGAIEKTMETIPEFDSLATMMLEVSVLYQSGAEKYGENNWKNGMPLEVYLDCALRHYLKQLRGDADEPHGRAVIWNLLGAIWTIRNTDNPFDSLNLISSQKTDTSPAKPLARKPEVKRPPVGCQCANECTCDLLVKSQEPPEEPKKTRKPRKPKIENAAEATISQAKDEKTGECIICKRVFPLSEFDASVNGAECKDCRDRFDETGSFIPVYDEVETTENEEDVVVEPDEFEELDSKDVSESVELEAEEETSNSVSVVTEIEDESDEPPWNTDEAEDSPFEDEDFDEEDPFADFNDI